VQRILEVPLDDYWMNKTKLFKEIMDGNIYYAWVSFISQMKTPQVAEY
jgi:hypothetical protein